MIANADPAVQFQFHHVGLAVHDLDAATRALAAIGLAPVPEFPDATDAALKVRLRFLRASPDQPLVELVEGLAVENPVARHLGQVGPGPYHLCFAVENLDHAASHLRRNMYRPVTGRIPAVAFRDALVQFFFHTECGLIEMVEQPPC